MIRIHPSIDMLTGSDEWKKGFVPEMQDRLNKVVDGMLNPDVKLSDEMLAREVRRLFTLRCAYIEAINFPKRVEP